MKKILIPTDFSEAANNALEAAIQIAKKSDQDLSLILVNVIDLDRYFTTNEAGEYVDARTDEKYKQHLIHSSGEKLGKLIEEYQLSNAEAKVEMGDVVAIINDYVENQGVDLIVIGAHTTSAYQEMLFSSTTDRVIRTVLCPVLSVRGKINQLKADNIVFATNLDEAHDRVFEQIKEIQRLFGSTLHLVYINTPSEFYNHRRIQSMKEEFLKKYPFENYTFSIYDDFTVETGVAHFLEDSEADMLALASTHFNNYLDYTTTMHTSDVITDEVQKPVITFPK